MAQDLNPTVASDAALSERVKSFAASQLFRRTFQDGMAMVEETANYLDGQGRNESKALPRRAALAYAGESMRLTTRLMQVASWLLVQRAINDGDMTVVEASKDKYRLGAREICTAKRPDATEFLPAKLVDLLERSEQIYERVDRLDQLIYKGISGQPAPDSVRGQMDKLGAAFGREK
jgi:regulator of CtrA degradation